MNQYVNRHDKDGIARIEFFTEKSNSLPSVILKSLAANITEAGLDSKVKLIILQSGGDKVFCAGASFEELASIQDHAQGLNFFSGFAEVILSIRSCQKIVLGRVQGKAVGGGVGLAAACDYTLASQYASIRLSELAVGIGPFVIGPAVERKMGTSAFSQLAINATEWQTAQWAKQKGLYQEVFDTTEQLDAYIDHFSGILLNSNPEALMALKNIFWQGTEHWPQLLAERASISGELVLSEFTRNAIKKFS